MKSVLNYPLRRENSEELRLIIRKNLKLKEGSFRLDIKKKYFATRVVK